MLQKYFIKKAKKTAETTKIFFSKSYSEALDNKLFIVIFVFLISIYLEWYTNAFKSGDFWMIHKIIKDFQNSSLQSWYFYGQVYYGNLFAPYYALFYWLFGDSWKNLIIYEHFTYLLAGYILFRDIKKPSFLTTALFSVSYLFLNRFRQITFTMSYPFTVLMISISYALVNHGYKHGYKNTHYFFIGLIASLSIWHVLIYAAIIPVFLAAVVLQKIHSKTAIIWSNIYYFIAGGVAGIIPFILATLETKGENLSWFTSNQSGNTVDSLRYWSKVVVTYFSPHIPGESIREYRSFFIANPQDFILSYTPALIVFLVVIISIIYLIKDYKRNFVHAAFLVILALMIFLKSVNPEESIQSNIRYLSYLNGLVWLGAAKALDIEIKMKKTGIISSVIKVGSLVIIIFSIAFGLQNYMHRYQGKQIYETITEDLMAKNINYLLCENYYNPCLAIHILSNQKIVIEIAGDKNHTQGRIPENIGIVSSKLRSDVQVHALTITPIEGVDTFVQEYNILGSLYTLRSSQ